MCYIWCLSEKKATLLNAREEIRNGELYYILEYTGVHLFNTLSTLLV